MGNDERYRIGTLVKDLSNIFDQRLTARLARQKLTATQAIVLTQLFEDTNRSSLRDIEKRCNVSHATITGVVRRLQAKGFVAYKTNEKDRREVLVYPTDKAMRMRDSMVKYIDEVSSRAFARMSPSEVSRMARYLEKIIANMRDDRTKDK
jgi:MarR family transcriptional regulator, repressor for mepA